MSALPDSDRIRIILVNTSHPGNIGATARAMKNMGLHRLYLVEPRDFPSGVAIGRAVGAVDILDQATVTGTLQDAVAECSLVIGASARSRSLPWPVLTPAQCGARVAHDSGNNEVALVFGREDAGLTNEELQLCHYHVQIPANEDYSSLNLASAVMVICYELRLALAARDDASQDGAGEQTRHEAALPGPEGHEADMYWDVERANSAQLEYFYEHLEKVLVDIDFHNPENPRLLMQRMRRLFGRIRPDRMEISILRGILTHIEYHLQPGADDDASPGDGGNTADDGSTTRD